MPGSLYVVSTPIGNLDDITLRALNVLKTVGVIAAEDTRRTAILLRHFGIRTPTTSLHAHNEQQKVPDLIERLSRGIDVAVVSDAGTPVVADPGQRLISAAVERGIAVVPIPGASALLSALSASGFGADEFVFGGFAPSKSSDRKRWLAQFRDEPRVVVFYETPHRITDTLIDMRDLLVDRPIVIGREITKVHEEFVRTTTAKAAALNVAPKGEFTIVIGPLTKTQTAVVDVDPNQVVAYFGQITDTGHLSRRRAAAITAGHFGLTTNMVYSVLEAAKTRPQP